MSIMVIGSEEEHHARHIYTLLQERGSPCFYLDTRAFPQAIRLSLTPNPGQDVGWIQPPDGEALPLAKIRSVYWRYHHGIQVSSEVPAEISGIVYREIDSALGSLFRNMPHTLWVNPPSAIDGHRYKGHQLQQLAQAGIRIPDTVVTNDPETVQAFFERHDGAVIYKPVSGGAHTAQLTPEDLTTERLADLAVSPVQFQELVPGVDIRVYLVGESLFAAEIQAGTLDFRDNPKAPIVPLTLPDSVLADCRTLAQLFSYRFTGIDIRRTPGGEYVFLEGNPSPMFMHFEKITGYPISQKLVELLETGLPAPNGP